MDKLTIDLENCFGIGKLQQEFDFLGKNSNTFMIYAPNGTMKTSFAKTLDLIAKNDLQNMPKDRLNPNKIPRYDVFADGNTLSHQNILVINAEDNQFDGAGKITNFLASTVLKEKFEKIHGELEAHKKEFIKILKATSKSTDCETEITDTFIDEAPNNFFEVVVKRQQELIDEPAKYDFNYNDIFDKAGKVEVFLKNNKELLNQYLADYTELINKSTFFKQSGNSFGTIQANNILKSIEDNAYFEAGHSFLLENGTQINSKDELKVLIEEELKSIIADEKLVKNFDKFDKAIGANTELRAFKKAVEKDNLLLVEITDYKGFRKKLWNNYLSEIKNETESIIKFYADRKADLEAIISEAKKELPLWREILKTFENRFSVPFSVEIANHDDVILQQRTPVLLFRHLAQDHPQKHQRAEILNILSKGEQRAFFILQFLFEIESRKKAGGKHLIIFDDVADSFDYTNKYAVIEYITELHNSGNFRMLVLTHNFDFYRTIFSRLLNYSVVFMAVKDDQKNIILKKGQYKENVFSYLAGHAEKPRVFISLIAFIRNLIEYTQPELCNEFMKLTSCLHLKADSQTTSAQHVFDIFQNSVFAIKHKSIGFGSENIIDFIFKVADEIYAENNDTEILIENKIPLAIAIRLKAERYMFARLQHIQLPAVTKNQTTELFRIFRAEFLGNPEVLVLEKVNLMTPENIHVNAFMFEPLIDMSIGHLKKLYNEVASL